MRPSSLQRRLICAFGVLVASATSGTLAQPEGETRPSAPALARTPRPLTLAQAANFEADERRLQRLEWQAERSRHEEQRAVEALIERLGRLERLVADITQSVERLPDGPALPVCAVPPTADAARPASGPVIGFLTGMALLTAYLVWQRRRRAQQQEAAAPPTVLAPSEPAPIPIPKRLRRATRAASAGPAAESTAPRPPSDERPNKRRASEATTQSATGESPTRLAPPPSPSWACSHNEVHELSMLLPPDETVELANIMLSMGLTKGAEDALLQRIRENPRHALYYWLKLLEVYRCAGLQEEYERARAELHALYNVAPERWSGDAAAPSEHQTLEDFQHVVRQLAALWPSPEARAYLEHLLADNREGTRQGFPQAVAEEILLLIAVLEARDVAAASHR